ncbi:S9 family peptidase [Paenalkalicoccus suaedae]|uniref:S9 family peptidase n=1 Tax=Paenalkalicoccus suaedae TaxID=2592382 RepID=A0A859FBS5_9BACI|nr:prolyl oligopeptidase family serine peptidase [Paenalkalicoccus suaedae]QKS70410.1 S9 family peptidase [Paenalkalicoccus suaedae]
MLKKSSLLGIVLIASACSSEEKEVLVEKELLENLSTNNDVNTWRIVYESDDYLIEGFVASPSNTEEKYPTLIINRGGNRDYGEIEEEWLHYQSLWAERGYTVISSQYREGGNSEGIDEYGGDDVNDVLQLQHVARELEFADEENTYMLGISRGGLMTYRAIQEGMPINAAATTGGVSDLLGSYEARGLAMRQELVELVGHPSEVPEEYERRSAINWSEDITSPLLLIHGEIDERVPFEQSLQLYQAMNENGQVVKLISYEDGDHGLDNYFSEYHRAIEEWFETY